MSKLNCNHCHENEHNHEEENKSLKVIRIVVAAVLWLIGRFFLEGQSQIVLFSLAYVVVGFDVIYSAFENLMHLSFAEETLLMTLASITAFFIGEASEGVIVMILYQLGEFLSDLAVDHSKDSIKDLLSKHPKTVHWLLNGKLIEADIETVSPGMLLQVRPGEEIPVDGIVKQGESNLDMSSITGESLPVFVGEGFEVVSGSINVDSLITIEATQTLANSTASKIAELVENCKMDQSKTETIVQRFTRFYTPAVMIFALCLAVFAPMVVDITYSESIKMACTLLVISCPCALVISVPLAFFCGVGKASKSGVLVKGAEYLESLSSFDYLALDKTGTLTTGDFRVVEVNTEMNRRDFLKIAASIEKNSNHPLAQAIVREYGEGEYRIVRKFSEQAGLGVSAKVGNKDYYLGNYRYIKKLKLKGVKELEQTAIYMATADQYIGNIVFADDVKEEARSVLEQLRSLGVKKEVILSGDKQGKVEALKEPLCLDEVYGNLMPEDKAEHVKSEKNKNYNVAYVGDGTNDGAVLALANTGITMGIRGSDLAIASSDVVLMHDDLNGLVKGRKIAEKTLNIVKQNIYFIFVCKFLFIVLGTLQLIPMWAAVFADVGVTLLTVLNSVRLFWFD